MDSFKELLNQDLAKNYSKDYKDDGVSARYLQVGAEDAYVEKTLSLYVYESIKGDGYMKNYTATRVKALYSGKDTSTTFIVRGYSGFDDLTCPIVVNLLINNKIRATTTLTRQSGWTGVAGVKDSIPNLYTPLEQVYRTSDGSTKIQLKSVHPYAKDDEDEELEPFDYATVSSHPQKIVRFTAAVGNDNWGSDDYLAIDLSAVIVRVTLKCPTANRFFFGEDTSGKYVKEGLKSRQLALTPCYEAPPCDDDGTPCDGCFSGYNPCYTPPVKVEKDEGGGGDGGCTHIECNECIETPVVQDNSITRSFKYIASSFKKGEDTNTHEIQLVTYLNGKETSGITSTKTFTNKELGLDSGLSSADSYEIATTTDAAGNAIAFVKNTTTGEPVSGPLVDDGSGGIALIPGGSDVTKALLNGTKNIKDGLTNNQDTCHTQNCYSCYEGGGQCNCYVCYSGASVSPPCYTASGPINTCPDQSALYRGNA